jgi:hypothetical protein
MIVPPFSESFDHHKSVIKEEPELKKPKLENLVKKEEPPSDDEDSEEDDDWKPEVSSQTNSFPVQKKSRKDKSSAQSKKVRIVRVTEGGGLLPGLHQPRNNYEQVFGVLSVGFSSQKIF